MTREGQFPTIDIPPDAAQRPEALGSRPKFWYAGPGNALYLYKQTRAGTGEDWAEKAAAELAGLLCLPHAEIELATWQGLRGVVSRSFVPAGGQLVLGNEILFGRVPGYPQPGREGKVFRLVPQHTVAAVLDAVSLADLDAPKGWTAPDGISTAADVFVGYLMFDAWIGNTDRHHENWAFVREARGTRPYLAPTYDHSSSLGRNESDDSRSERLTTRDKGRSVEVYVEKAVSALYATDSDRKPLRTLQAFQLAAGRRIDAARAWLEILRDLPSQQVGQVFERIADERISSVAREFAMRILDVNRMRLLNQLENLP